MGLDTNVVFDDLLLDGAAPSSASGSFRSRTKAALHDRAWKRGRGRLGREALRSRDDRGDGGWVGRWRGDDVVDR